MDARGELSRLRRRATVRDVAAAANVSVGVASVVLRDVPSTIRVGLHARARVRRAAQDLGYRPNAAAQALRTGRTHAIGVAVRQLRSPVFAAVIEGIEAICWEAGYHLLLAHVHRDEQAERETIRLFSRGQVDGLMVLGEIPHDERAIQLALADGRPIVLVARPALEGVPGVMVDQEAGLRLALEHLATLGHQRIALRSPNEPPAAPASRMRMQLAQSFAAARGWAPPLAFYAEGVGLSGMSAWLRDALSATPPLTAVLASDETAVRVLKAAQAAAIRVPEQLSIVALDGTEVTSYTSPELTSVTQPLEAVGAAAARLLIERIDSDTADAPSDAPSTTMLQPTFTIRESTSAAPLT